MKRYLIIVTLMLTIVSIVYGELEETGYISNSTDFLASPAQHQITGDRSPEFSFHIEPIRLMTTFYGYFFGGYNSFPIAVQPSPAGMNAGGGVYMTFLSDPAINEIRRIYYAYILDGNLVGTNQLDPGSPASIIPQPPNLAIDSSTGNPLYAYAKDDEDDYSQAFFVYDDYSAIGFPGLTNSPYKVTYNPYSIDEMDNFEFLHPTILIGDSPNNGMKRVYIIAQSDCRFLLLFADFSDIMDLSSYDPEQWTEIIIPRPEQWEERSLSLYASPVIAPAGGNIAIIGHSVKIDAQEAYSEHNVLFVFENHNYGEGEWTYTAVDPTIRIDNPLNPETNEGYFTDREGQPYVDMRYEPYLNRHTAVADDEGNYHFTAFYRLTTEGMNWYPDLSTSKHIKYISETGEFRINDLYPKNEDGSRYLPWTTPPQFDDEGVIIANLSYPCSSWDTDEYAEENYQRIITQGPRMVALFQDSHKARQYFVHGIEDYALERGAETLIFVSNNFGETWSDPIVLGTHSDLAPPELREILPAYWYLANHIEDLGGDWGRVHLVFLDKTDTLPQFGNQIFYTAIDVNFPLQQVKTDTNTEVQPLLTNLQGNYPNPFNPYTLISYSLQNDTEHLELSVYNIKGQLVRTLYAGAKQQGKHNAVWDGKDEKGNDTASGVYLYRLKTNEFDQINKMTLLR